MHMCTICTYIHIHILCMYIHNIYMYIYIYIYILMYTHFSSFTGSNRVPGISE